MSKKSNIVINFEMICFDFKSFEKQFLAEF